jgi:hypothetical protein
MTTAHQSKKSQSPSADFLRVMSQRTGRLLSGAIKSGTQFFRNCSLAAAFTAAATPSLIAADYLKKSSYYTEAPQFHTWPDPAAARYEISRIGPIGLSLELIQPAFTMRISAVEPGSPAAATGQLKKGQIIQSINGKSISSRAGYRDIKAMSTAKFGEPKKPAIPKVGKRDGSRPTGLLFTKEVREEMKDGKFVLAVSGFLNYAGGKKANCQSFWFEEMKLPEAVK